MQKVLLLALLVLPDGDQRARDFFDRIQFDQVSADSDESKKVLEILLKKEHWIGAYRSLERQLGPMPDNLVVKVEFSLEGGEAGWGGARGSEGKIRFNMKVLSEAQKHVEEIEAKRKEAALRGQRIVYRVPPVKIDRLIYHELTHVFQRSCQAPPWFIEGMAQLIGDDPNNLASFVVAGKKVEAIDEQVMDRNDTYARGHLFWKWIDSKGATKKVAELVVLQHRSWKEALEEATGFPWSILTLAEKEWSAKEFEKLEAKDPKGR